MQDTNVYIATRPFSSMIVTLEWDRFIDTICSNCDLSQIFDAGCPFEGNEGRCPTIAATLTHRDDIVALFDQIVANVVTLQTISTIPIETLLSDIRDAYDLVAEGEDGEETRDHCVPV